MQCEPVTGSKLILGVHYPGLLFCVIEQLHDSKLHEEEQAGSVAILLATLTGAKKATLVEALKRGAGRLTSRARDAKS